MGWSASGLSRQFMIDRMAGTIPTFKWVNTGTPDSFKVALYDNNLTPSRDDTAAQYAYAGTSWPAAGSATGGTGTANAQVYQAVQWPQAGIALATGGTSAGTGGSGIAMFDAADLASGTACTISSAYGCLVYDDTLASPVADQGICHNSFGTGAAVTNGTFTIQWSASGVWRVT